MSWSDHWSHGRTLLAVSTLAYFGVRFVEFALSIVFEDIKATLGLSTFVIGLGVAASTLTYAVAQVPSGALGDRVGHRSVVLGSLGLTGAAACLLAAAPGGAFVVAGMALVGLVSGAYYSPATALLSRRLDGTARAIGVHRLGAQAVGLTGPVVAVAVTTFGWRSLLVGSGLLVVPALVGYALLVPARTTDGPSMTRDRPGARRLSDLLADTDVALTTAIAALAQFVDTATFSFLPLLLRAYHDLPLGLAAGLFTAYFLAVSVSQPAAGWLAGRLRRGTVTLVALSLAVVGYLVLLLASSLGAVAGGVLVVGLGMGWGPPVQARLVEHFPDGDRGRGFGLVRAAYIGFAALNGLLVGFVVTRSGWGPGIGVLLVAQLGAVCLLALRWLRS